MNQIGKEYTCDRCGAKVFVRYIGEKDLDGGWTKVYNFEKPTDWGYDTKIGDMCPECTKKFNEMIENFKTRKE